MKASFGETLWEIFQAVKGHFRVHCIIYACPFSPQHDKSLIKMHKILCTRRLEPVTQHSWDVTENCCSAAFPSREDPLQLHHTHTHTPAKSLQDLSLLLWHLNHHTVTASFFFSTCDNMTAPKASWWVRCQEVVVSKRQWETDRLTEESARQLVTQQIRVLLRHCSAFSDIIQPSDSAAEVRWRHPGQTTTFTTCDSWSSQVQKISGGDFIGKQHQLKSNLHM